MRPKEPCFERDVWEEMQEPLVAESEPVLLCVAVTKCRNRLMGGKVYFD